MILETFVLFIEFAVQTVFLTLALWIMIKLQKLDYNFPGLLGTGALVSGLDRILQTVLGHFVGIYLTCSISAPIEVIVLIFCISKVTHADRVDVLFTIMVGYALMFGMNLWLFGALLGDLRPSARNNEELNTFTQPQPTNSVQQIVTRTNRPASGAPAKLAMQLGSEQLVGATTNLFSVIGVTRNGSNSAVTIRTGKKAYTISLGESALTQTSNGPVSVRFKELGDSWVLFVIDGQETKLPFH